ncbi:SfnB family sulfur acquisition oxidoreductase [Nocardioides luteus]|uniref:Dibenzothiophene monooxygenase n=1 Tax=Nocardioides luteus TaxID=1844 RepID=A0ABQ5SVU2_9ACTN|nr:SfnB family sulfur acquisition oxidoreductase [Nocardioides luteus]MDR7312061.1 SfnB family sulfur acquisition oxidoreductase [Nocardioides luteus]GGR72306.1 SfnB family sulfur acquisition oxidoreductase [Nocardioides luteus]GLJ68308.1 SfnB family sulfur acquisition oxidoreductase [Nocardioides luteus]
MSTTEISRIEAETAPLAARRLAEELALGDGARDRGRVLPHDQVRAYAAAGLGSLTVPLEFGGPALSASTVAEVFRLVSWGDPNVGQVPHSHFVFLNQLRLNGTREQQQRIYSDVRAGALVANAQSEFGTKHVRDIRTALTPAREEGEWLLNGEKFYCTGSLFADYLAVLARRGVDGPLQVAWVRTETPGVEIIDDWDAVGQRTTGSGTVRLTDVVVAEEWITPFAVTFDRPTTYGAFAQLLHAAIDAGIARRALDEASEFVLTMSRPYADAVALAGAETAAQDPLVVHAFGEMELAVRSAEALLAEAGRRVDEADADLTAESAAEASLAVAAARASTAQVSVDVSSRLLEVSGTRAALSTTNLDRHWRNARTHTLHDPAAWKVHHLGRWAVDGTQPPRHGQL